ncbi:MAG: response regulator [Desulfobulbales bacterium]|nr:response regulator [Desulfobulbales bacterium]
MARVLVIDDDLQLRKLLCKILAAEEYEAHDAANGIEGLDLIKKQAFDLVVTDIFMPGEDGLGTIMEICRNYPDIKIIAMTGGGSVKDVDFLKLASNLGAEKVFQKPVDMAVFMATVKDVLQE